MSFQRRFPDFSYIIQNGRLTDFLDCVIIRLVYIPVPSHWSVNLIVCTWPSLFPPPQSFPLGPLWRFALHERDGGLRRPHLHDPSYQSHLSHFAWGLPKDHCGQKGRNQLLHVADDQGLHEESDTSEPPPNGPGAVFMLFTSAPALPLFLQQIELLLLCCWWQVDDELEIKAYYAGHVLGAAMVHIKVGSESVVYTVSVSGVHIWHHRVISE